MSRGRWLLVLLPLGVAVLGIAGRVALPHLGHYLIVVDPVPPHADAIVVMAGLVADRVLEAAKLYSEGHAPRIVLTRERLRRGVPALRARGVPLPENEDLARGALVALGVPPEAIVSLRRRNLSTVTEARTIARWACRHRIRRLIVVSSRAHTRRLRLILGRVLPPGTTLSVVPSRFDGFSSTRWWRVRHDAKVLLAEYEKLLNYWLRERWQLEPCGGLRQLPRTT